MIRSLIAAGAVAALALTAGAALADPPASPPASAAPAAPTAPTASVPDASQPQARNPDTEIVCKTEDATGSRLGAKRVCLTRAQWKARSVAGQEALEELRKDRGFTPK